MKLEHYSINDKRWIQLPETTYAEVGHIDQYSIAFKRILVRKLKDLTSSEKFLNPNLDQLYDPFLLKGMGKAVERIHHAMANRESIWLFGDYDVDGITSVALLLKCFKALDYPVNFYIPDRHEEGYGLNPSAIESIAAQQGKVIITVDCGITSVKEALLANTLGVDMIITDHHECQEQIPDAFAVINPKQSDCGYPFKMLAGVGIAYKLASALMGELIHLIRDELLELAAFGTIADIAPLTDENRVIAKFGLEALSQTANLGFEALIHCSELQNKKITAGHVGFMLAPKINAAGRIDDPKLGVTLLTTSDREEAETIASLLKETNDRRQQMEKEILEAAIQQVESRATFKNEHITIVYGDGWNSGVIGIVASRLVEKYHKPTIVFSVMDGKAKGSARSIDGVDIFEILCKFTDLYEKFGGHEQAAGLTIPYSNFEQFLDAIHAYCKEHIDPYLLTPALKIDETVSVSEVNFNLLEELSHLEPYGMGNAKPLFKLEGVQIQKKVLMGKNKEFTKYEIADDVRTFEAISFDRSGYYDLFKPGDLVDLVCHLDINEFSGTQTIQFLIKDIRGYRQELFKSQLPLAAFRRAEAERIIYEAMEASDSFSAHLQESQPIDETKVIWSIESIEGLVYYYNRLYDGGIQTQQLLMCPNEALVENNEAISVEEHFELHYVIPSTQLKASWIPDRNDLIDYYKQLRSESHSALLPLTVAQWLCALVLEAGGLVTVSKNEIQLNSAPSQKIDLMTLPVFISLQQYKAFLKR